MANFPLSPFDPALIFQFSYTTLPAMHPALLVLKDLKSQNKILPDIKRKKYQMAITACSYFSFFPPPEESQVTSLF